MQDFQVPVLDIYVTGVCNLDCGYCFGELDTRPGMPRPMFEMALTFARAMGASTIELCGGEPLLYKDFEWAVRQAQAAGFRLILRTNGYYLERRRAFVARSFAAVGLSLDGDPESNDRMRPQKGGIQWTPRQKFETPLNEVLALKALNPSMQVILASVATRQNVEGIERLADILLERQIPIDVWKVYQFVSNYFRALANASEFNLADDSFAALCDRLKAKADGKLEMRCRTATEVDGSCLIVSQSGDILVGGKPFGHVSQNPGDIMARFRSGTEAHISGNKHITYASILPMRGPVDPRVSRPSASINREPPTEEASWS
jgi:MoaA/NifB/PqqE/SkfB family radical SAM enzyme